MSDGTPPAPHDPTTPAGPPPGQAPQGYGPGGYPPQGAYQQPGGYPPQGAPAPASSPFGGSSAGASGASLWLSLASILCVTLAVLLEEDGTKAWDSIGVWVIFAIAASVLTLAASIGGSLNLSKEKGWKVAAGGAVGLIVFWVLHVLPAISKNVSFLATVGVVAGGAAVWLADGRPEPAADGSAPETW